LIALREGQLADLCKDAKLNGNEKTCWLVNLGLVGYEQAFELQRRTVAARKAGAVPDVLFLCEHPHVITLGRNGHRENLLASQHLLRQMGVEFHSTDRGGDITYHGPGQVVGYPILDLAAIRRDVGWYVRQLEEAMIRATAEFGIAATRKAGMTGAWVELANGAAPEKLAAIGVHLSRWVTSHGFAYNVSTDLRYFDLIVPCGIADKRATSLERLLGRAVRSEEVAPRIVRHLAELFGRETKSVSRDEFERALEPISQQLQAPASVTA
jgi:lipoyl(octanoyl) transferase